VSQPGVYFTYEAMPGRVVFGVGAARTRIAEELDRLGARRLLLLAGEREESRARDITREVADRVVGVFSGVRPHVPIEVADQACARAASAGADALLSVGGGSTTGTAKAVALTTGLPVVAVPTTYAGSEMTPVWGLTAGGHKTTGTDRAVLPRVVIYDPELTASLPPGLSAVSGLNAMAHCVEAFWAPGRNPISSLLGEAAIRALKTALPLVVADGADIGARSDALYGAYLAGSAFAVAGSGLHHKICHVLGGAFDLPHAETHAVVLPYVLAFNAASAPRAASRIAAALGADDAARGLWDLCRDLGVPRSLRKLGLRKEQLEEVVGSMYAVIPPDNPRAIGEDALRRLLAAAWAGEEPDHNPIESHGRLLSAHGERVGDGDVGHG